VIKPFASVIGYQSGHHSGGNPSHSIPDFWHGSELKGLDAHHVNRTGANALYDAE